MSGVEHIVLETTKLSARLRSQLGADGWGLTHLFGSVHDRFENPSAVQRQVEKIADERNAFVHDGRDIVQDAGGFSRTVRRFNRDINTAVNTHNSIPFWQVFLPDLIFLLIFRLGLLFAFGAILAVD
jgi:hypothetical protein